MDELIRKRDAIKAICEDGTWLERQGCTEITVAERKQRDADIIENLPTVQMDFYLIEKTDKAYDDGYEAGYLQAQHDWGNLDE